MVTAVVREGGVVRAAKSLNKVPSALTHAIQKLERDLDAELFQRAGRSLVPTEAGLRLVEQGEFLLEQALDLETSVRQMATGWDGELRVAVSDIVPSDWILSIVESLYSVSPHTEVSIQREVLAGSWDAIVSGRADLVIGAPGKPPAGRGLAALPMGGVEFVVAVAPHHPLADTPNPLNDDLYRRHRVAVVPDTSRSMPKMTTGLFAAQPTLVVPDFEAKRLAQLMGLAVGSLPRYLIEDDLRAGRLVHKPFAKPYYEPVTLAWRLENSGRALLWMREEVMGLPADWLHRAD